MVKNKTQKQIIIAAGETFHRFGYKKTTMDDIALSAGKGKSSLYYYFKNKEEVFEAVVDMEAQHIINDIHEALAETELPLDKLRKYIRIRMQRFVARGNLYLALNDNFLATFSFIEKIRIKHQDWEMEVITEILKEGITRGDFKIVDPQFMGHIILTAMIGFEYPLLKNPDSNIKFERKIEQVINLLFFGICS